MINLEKIQPFGHSEVSKMKFLENNLHLFPVLEEYRLNVLVSNIMASIREEKIGSKKSARFTKGRGVAKFIWSMPLYGGNTNQKGASLSVKVELS